MCESLVHLADNHDIDNKLVLLDADDDDEGSQCAPALVGSSLVNM